MSILTGFLPSAEMPAWCRASFKVLASFGSVAFCFFIIAITTEVPNFRGNPLTDAGEWGLASYTITNNVRLVWAVLMSIIVGMMINCVFYFWDLLSAQSAYRHLVGVQSGRIQICLVLNIVAIFSCFAWLVYLWIQANTPSWNGDEILPRPGRVLSPLTVSSFISIGIFALFAAEDYLLLSISKRALRNWDLLVEESGGGHSSETAKKELGKFGQYASDSLWLIDFPVIFGSLLLLGFTLFEQQTHILGNGLTQSAMFFYPIDSARDPSYLDHGALLRVALNAPVQIGFAGGAHVTQLFISQVIFWVLTIRNR